MIEFDWDQNNIKHVCEDYPERRNTVSDVESVFYDPDFMVIRKLQSGDELRFYAAGRNSSGFLKVVVYITNNNKLRPISCWPANSQTKRTYYENVET